MDEDVIRNTFKIEGKDSYNDVYHEEKSKDDERHILLNHIPH